MNVSNDLTIMCDEVVSEFDLTLLYLENHKEHKIACLFLCNQQEEEVEEHHWEKGLHSPCLSVYLDLIKQKFQY